MYEYHHKSKHHDHGVISCPSCNYTDYDFGFKSGCPSCKVEMYIGYTVIAIWRY